jgi:hypothetical protein
VNYSERTLYAHALKQACFIFAGSRWSNTSFLRLSSRANLDARRLIVRSYSGTSRAFYLASSQIRVTPELGYAAPSARRDLQRLAYREFLRIIYYVAVDIEYLLPTRGGFEELARDGRESVTSLHDVGALIGLVGL